jgi:hypothetical protein
MKPSILLIGSQSSVLKALEKELSIVGIVYTLTSIPKELSPVNYVVILENESLYVSQLESFLLRTKPKTLVVIPIHLSKKEFLNKIQTISQKVHLKILYRGESVFDQGGYIDKLLSEVSKHNQILVPEVNSIYYLFPLKEGVERIVRELFSYDAGSAQILGKETTLEDISKRLIEITGIEIHKETNFAVELPQAKRIDLPDIAVEEFRDKIDLIRAEVPVPKTQPSTITQKRKPRKYLLWTFLTLVWLLSFPLVSLFITGASGYLSFKQLEQTHLTSAKRLLSVANAFAVVAERGLLLYREIPVIGGSFETGYNLSRLTQAGTIAINQGIEVVPYIYNLSRGILTNEEYSVKEISQKLVVELDYLYKQTSFIESSLGELEISLPSLIPELAKMETYRGYLLAASKISSSLPALLGDEKPKTYLVLFQNNMELRPTGGFIGSFALVTFSHGKLIDTEVFDVYDADGQLKGYVAPPEPIEKYLGEESWYLRDSNWDPDFASSAKKAEWFIDKTIDRQVDGVIGVNLEVIKNVLKETGPVKLADYNDEITHENVYEKVQHEVEKDFFPGSKRKASYLTSLTAEVLKKLEEMPPSNFAKISRGLAENLAARDIQVYFHDEAVSGVTSVLGWNGEVEPHYCAGNCDSLWFGLAEANVGVNKANYYIDRAATYGVEMNADKITQTLTLHITNTYPSLDRIPETRYKAYVRVFVQPGTTFEKVTVSDSTEVTIKTPEVTILSDRKEGGVLVEVLPGSKKTVTFVWSNERNSTFAEPGKLEIDWRKQAGVEPHPVTILVNVPQEGLTATPPFSLTDQNAVGYNTTLSSDFRASIEW